MEHSKHPNNSQSDTTVLCFCSFFKSSLCSDDPKIHEEKEARGQNSGEYPATCVKKGELTTFTFASICIKKLDGYTLTNVII